MTLFLFLFSAFSVFAQEFQFRLEGSFPTTSGAGTPGTPTTINYSINWNETEKILQGLYRDSFFTQGGPSIVTGTVSAAGRKMQVILPEAINGVKQINLSSTSNTKVNQSIPMKVVTMSNEGSGIDSPPINTALLTAITEGIRAIDTEKCTTGFGVLSGYCGIYDGTFSEASDGANKCNLLAAGNPRLEVGEDTVLRLYLNYIKGAPNQSSHTIGSLPLNPQSNVVNITSRNCSDLPGTEFATGDCYTVNLSGEFRREAGEVPRFTGSYTLTDDMSGESCSYSMTVTRGVSL